MNKDTPWWLFADFAVPAVLIGLWGPPVFAFFQLSKGNFLIGASVLVLWVPMFAWIVSFCHRRSIVRVWFALGSTVVVLVAFGVIIFQKL